MADPGRFIRWTHSTAPHGCKYLLFLISHPQEVGAQDVDIQTRKDRQTEATTHTRCQWTAATLEWSGSEKQHQSADLSCLLSGCCWRRNGAGDIFLTHFGPLSRNWLLFRHTDDKHTPVRPRGAIFWWRTTQHDTKSESSEAAFLNMTSSSFPNRLKSHRVSIQCVASQQNRVMLSIRTEMSAGMFKWLVKTVTQMIEADQMAAMMENFSFLQWVKDNCV